MFQRGGISFTLAAVVALGVGIGANTAIFSLVNTVILRESPFPNSDRIVILQTKTPGGSFGGGSPTKFAHWAQQTRVLEDVTAFGGGILNWTSGQFPQQLRSERVSSAYFRLFGVPFVAGRPFSAEEDKPGAAHVVVIGEGLWATRFRSDPNVVGRTMLLGGELHVITGVASARFDFEDFGERPEVWVPFQLDPDSVDQGHYFSVAARLKPGVNLAAAKAQLGASAAAYRSKFPDSLPRDQSFDAAALRASLVQGATQSIWVLAGAVGFVLMIACANVANLLLARAEVRKQEFGIRASLGAGRFRIVRQLLVESLLLAVAGSILGLVLGMVGIRVLLSVNTAGLPRVGTDGSLVSLDWHVLLFTALIALLTSLIFGLVPAWHAARTDLNSTLKEASSRSGSGFRQNKTRTMLVVTEVAMAVILLVGAGLLIRTALALYSVPRGFETRNILTMRMSLSSKAYETSTGIEQLIRIGTESLNRLPGVDLASATCCIPLEGGYGLPFKVMGRPLTDGPFHGGGGWKTVSPGFFEVFRIPFVRGRSFTDRDGHGGVPVVIINQSMAKRFWPKGDPLMDRILIGKGVMPQLENEQPRQIIGIVADQRDGALNQNPEPEMFIPNGQATDEIQALNVKLTPFAWVIRTRGAPMLLRRAIEERLRQVSGLPVSDVRTMDEVVSRSTARERFHMLLMTVFGGVSLLLAAIGIYSLIAYSVELRTQEIGIRMALGASRGDVRRMIMKQGLLLALIGVVLGVAIAFVLTKQIVSFLFGVTAWDPLVFGTVPVVLLATSALAVWWPSIRATRVDPAAAVRQS